MLNTIESPVRPSVTADDMDFGKQIAANMCGVDLIIHRPSGKYKVKHAEVTAADDTGATGKLDVGKVTNPSFIIDGKSDHPLWSELDENARQFSVVLRRYAVSDAKRGMHLVPMGRTGNLLQEFRDKRHQRIELAMQLRDAWPEVIDRLRAKFNGHFYLLAPNLPNPDSLVEKLDVQWFLQPLTPINPESLKFDSINEVDRERIITESNRMAQHMIERRAKLIYDEAFGSMLEKCDQIAAGAMETGKRKFGCIAELVDGIERMKNFHEWSTPAVMSRANEALSVLKGITNISSVNDNDGQNQVTRAIVDVMKPLGDAVQKMLSDCRPSGGRAARILSM